MDVEHSIEIIAKVNGVQVHSDTFTVAARGTVADAMAGLDSIRTVARVMRQVAGNLDRIADREDAWHPRQERFLRHQDVLVIDADAGALPAAGD